MELGGELSEELSSHDSLLGSTSSGSSSATGSHDAPAEVKTDEAKPAVAAEPDKSESGKNKPGGVAKPEAASKKPAPRSKKEHPHIPPGEPAFCKIQVTQT